MSVPDQPKLLIVGTGALACLFAARLAASGIQVTMLGTWREGLLALQRQGVCLVAGEDEDHFYPVRATDRPQDCRRIRFALVLVKSWQTVRAARQLSECLPEDGLALSLQNGLGNREQLAQALGEKRVALGVTTTGATLLGPGRVRPAGEGVISLGSSPRLAPLAGWLRLAGLTVEFSDDTGSLLWGKLVINAAINPLTALLGVTNGELLARQPARAVLRAAAGEAATVSAALGIRLPFADPVAAAEAVAQRTAKNRSSMLQDVQRGAQTEIDAICGAIVQAGNQAGVPTPNNWMLWQLVSAMEAGEGAIL